MHDLDFELRIESPGRINLIGEHIDYNGGHVLPAAIDKRISLSFRRSGSDQCHIRSEHIQEGFSFSCADVRPGPVLWQNYILGVVHHIGLRKPGRVEGFDCIIRSNLPIGAGISSSAALECGIAKGLNELFDIGLTNREIIEISRDAEHSFVGTKCGIMDQFSVVMGRENHLILLDCQTLDHSYIEADFDPYQIVLLNTNVSHSLATGEYNNRRADCESALEEIRKRYTKFEFLCDVPEGVLAEFRSELTRKQYERSLFAIKENQRTMKAAEALSKRHFKDFGALLYQSHEGLKTQYEVSCPELDFMVDFSKNFDSVIGSRMMGGGFGGCTINLIHKEQADDYIKTIEKTYALEFKRELTPIKIKIGGGVRRSLPPEDK